MKKININIMLITIVSICSIFIIAIKTTINRLSMNNTTIIDIIDISEDINQADTSGDNGAYYSNLNFNFNNADPTIIKYNGCLYVFGTDHASYKSCDSKTWSKYSYTINGTLPSYDYFWAPEVYKIGNYYYMLFTLVTWGKQYPWSEDSHGSVYYARSTDLVNFTYLGEMPYGSSFFDGKVDNKNHIDGSLLIEGNKYYFYYNFATMDKTIPNNDTQELYGIELSLNSNGTFSQVGNPKLIIRRNKEAKPADSSKFTWTSSGNDYESIDEGPYVIKRNGKYYLTFSTGNYTTDTYRVIVATSKNPLGPYFRDKSGKKTRHLLTGRNYTNNKKTDKSRDSSKYIYGTGHGSILTLSFNDSLIGDYKEYYYAYHSNKYENGTLQIRKLTIDGVGFDKSGNMFVNGPTTDNQPLISGSTLNGVTYYKIPNSKYKSTVLTDGIKYTSKSIKAKTLKTKEVSLSFKNNERVNLTDIWIYGDGSNLGTVSGKVYINGGSTTLDFSQAASGSSLKIQLPSIEEKVKNIKVVFNKTLVLSEVELVRSNNKNYYLVSFDGNGGSISTKSITVTHNAISNNKIANIPTRSGYVFLGWYTNPNNGELVYNSNGNYNKSAYWNASGSWIYKNDVTLYAHWQKQGSTTSTGDVNGDGTISSIDYILVKKNITGDSKLDDNQTKRADTNSDGQISSLDYIAIKKSIINK